MKQTAIFLLLHISIASFGQSRDSTSNNKNSIQFELFGNGIVYSVNYERIFMDKPTYEFCIKLGLSYISNTLSGNSNSPLGLISEFDFLIGKKLLFFEIGSGFTYWNDFKKHHRSTAFFIPRIGFRYKFSNHGSFLRIGYTPLINIRTDSRLHVKPKYLSFGGISFGYSF